MKRDKQIFVLIIFVVISILVLILFLILNNIQIFSGNTVTNGGISLFIEAPINITIYSPENKTYEFNLSDGVFNPMDNKYYFLMDLEVSSSMDVTNWYYSLYLEGILQDSYIDFFPNQTILARIGQNTVVIYARSPLGRVYNKSVSFTIKTEMSSPIIDISEELVTCEGERFRIDYNITDYDSDLERVDILPKDFFFTRIKSSLNAPQYIGEIYSSNILKQHNVGVHNKILYAVDSKLLVDEKNIIIHVLDVNSIPEVENLGVYKIWTKGLDTTFNKNWQVIDSEDGSSMGGLMSFNLTFADNTTFPLFGINKYGEMNYDARDNPTIGSFILKTCVTDNPLALNEELGNYIKEYCGEDSLDSNTVCDEFGFTISDENRIPYILSSYPISKDIVMNGTVEYHFNVLFGDLDNDVLLVEWYVDDIEKQSTIYYEDNVYEHTDTFNFSFECGVSGRHNISTVIYDGINNVSKVWDVNVILKECPKEDISKGGGGGPGDCYELWTCYDWSPCQSTEESHKLNLIERFKYQFHPW